MERQQRRAVGILVGLFLSTGCATLGPQVSRQEIRQARQELQVKSLLSVSDQERRLLTIGHRLIDHLPPQDRRGPYPDLGVVVATITPTARAAFGYAPKLNGAYILALREQGPAEAAGLKVGDLMLALGGKRCSAPHQFQALAGRLRPGAVVSIHVQRGMEALDVPVTVGTRPRMVQFMVSRDEHVNAWAKGAKEIGVTSGLLHFLQSDDELAAILGHELAHITENHRLRGLPSKAISTPLSLTIGALADLAVPGASDAVVSATAGMVESAFAWDFEREADYRGLLHAYRAGYDIEAGVRVWERFGIDAPSSLTADLRTSHPSSPERMVRMRKLAESLGKDGLEATIAKYEGRASR